MRPATTKSLQISSALLALMLVATSLVLISNTTPAAAENLVEQQVWAKNSQGTWKTLRDGTEQGTQWRQLGFDDSSWADVNLKDYTRHGLVPDGGRRGYYYREEFELTDVWQITAIKTELYYDDAVVMYLNGNEVYRTIRNNLPTDQELSIMQTIPYGGAEDYYVQIPAQSNYCERGCLNGGRTDPIDAANLVEGTNVIGLMAWTTPGSDLGVDIGFTVVRDLDARPPGPEIEAVDAQASMLADDVNVQLTATTQNNPPITWQATGLPDGLAIDAATGLISGSPTNEGAFDVVAIASDDVGPNEVEFSWDITNAPPILTKPLAQQTPSFSNVNLTIEAVDPDGGELTFAVDGLPPGMTMDSAGVITGSSSAEDAYTVVVTVTDDEGASVMASFPWQVAEPPIDITNPGEQESVFNEAVELELSATDPAGDVTLSVEDLPPGLTFDPATNKITGAASAVGDFFVIISGSGPSGNSVVAFPWTVPNVLPTVTLPEAQTALAQIGVRPQLVIAADPDGGAVTLKASDLPPGIAFDPAVGEFSGIPSQDGTFTVSVTATDDEEGATTSTFEWQVLPAVEKPVVINEVVSSNSESLVDEDEDSPDWIELHNPTPITMDLDGWTLQDSTGQWTVPAVSIPSNGYLILFASDKDRVDPDAELHTNFKLSKEGDSLTLTDSAGFVVDQLGGEELGMPRQFEDVAYGVAVDDGTLGYLGSTTPGQANSALGTDFAPVLRQFTDRLYNVGDSVSEQIDAFDPEGGDMRYSLAPAPSGVTLAFLTGVIAGKTRSAGEWTTTLGVSDPDGLLTEQEVKWYVIAEPTGPSQLVLNEYNAVSPGSELVGDPDPAFAADELGNGGDWFEFVVVEDGLDIRGWTIELWDRDTKNELLTNSAALTFADSHQLNALPSGTVITISEDQPDDLSFDPDNGDWHINLRATDTFDGAHFTEESQENFNSSRSNQNVIIRNAKGENVAPVVGETEAWDEFVGGVGGGEVMSLCINPTDAQVVPIEDYLDNAVSSSFGNPNTCLLPGEDPLIPDDDVTFVQDLSGLRSGAALRQLGMPEPEPTPTPTPQPTPTPIPEPTPNPTPLPQATPTPDPAPVLSPNGPSSVATAVSCLAENGRVDINMVNPGTEAATYRIAFEGLTARQRTVEPGDWWRMPITGRPDRPYKVVVTRDDVIAFDETVTVACDTNPPVVPSPEIQIVNSCRSDNGYVLFQFANKTEANRGWVIEFQGVTNRSTSAPAYGAAVRAVTGRPDGDYAVTIRSGGKPIMESTITVNCD